MTTLSPSLQRFAPSGRRPGRVAVLVVAGVLALLVAAPRSVPGADLPPFEAAAAKMSANVCTVRAAIAQGRAAIVEGEAKTATDRPSEIRVYSAVCLAEGLLVCPLDAARAVTLRVTFPGGAQDDATLRAFDEHAGLALLELKRTRKEGLAPTARTPAVGAWVLGAAAWGAEAPVVSVGMVSGVDRTYAGSTYPPLLQADVRTAPTSAGGPIVDSEGALLGVVVHDDEAARDDRSGGWTYAVPASHVERLVRVHRESRRAEVDDAARSADDSVIVLQRRRPTVGMILAGKGEFVVVDEVTGGGPAERAGLRAGDVIVATDGVQIRSVYQAIRPSLFKQPGDEMTFRALRAGEALDFSVVLGGGVTLEPEQGVRFAERSAPKVVVRRDDLARYFDESTASREPPSVRERRAVDPAADDGARKLLETALERYAAMIELQRKEIELRREENELLAGELKRLSERVDAIDGEKSEESADSASEAPARGDGG